MALITLARAVAHLRLPSDYPAEQVQPYIDGAEAFALKYLGRPVFADDAALAAAGDDAGPDAIVINSAIESGILLIVSHLFRNRDEVPDDHASPKYPMAALSILHLWRVDLGVS